RLAVQAAAEQVARAGDEPPTELGPADDPTARPPRGVTLPAGRDRRLPAGRLVLVAGHRPDALGGYDENPVAAGVRTRLAETLRAMVEVDGPLTVVTGLRLGAEMLGAEAALDA